MPQSPPSLLGAAGIQAAETALVLAATVLAGIDTAAGRSYRVGSGIALTALGLLTVAALAAIAVGLARARRWSRTPALLSQLFIGIIAIYVIQGGRYEWGVPALVLALAGFAALLLPQSMRALAGDRQPSEGTRPPTS